LKRWEVIDRAGREIYLTEERWLHITSGHLVLEGHLEDVLDTLRFGRRRQDQLQPYKYFYRRRCDTLLEPFNRIVVIVLEQPNNRYVITAWAEIEE
jgi:hypothetical protein